MSFLSPSHSAPPPRNLCELLLQDVASLLITSRVTSGTLAALRPECVFSHELTRTLDSIIAISNAGARQLQESLGAAGAVLPPLTDTAACTLVTGFLTGLPAAGAPGILAAEITTNLRLLVQHIELKARLAAEEALLVGQERIGQTLLAWSIEWRNCGRMLGPATVRAHAHAYIADIDGKTAAQGA